MPSDVKGKIKVVGLLEGWPFAVEQEPTEVDPKVSAARSSLGQLFRLLQTAVSK